MNQIVKALGIVVAVCIAVVVLAPMVVSVLPDLVVIGIVVFLISSIFGGPRFRDRD